MVIKIDALDTLFFRDGKPFERGEEAWADGLFPPYPSVIYGALRSAYFSEHPSELGKANSEGDPTRDFRITNFYLAVDDQPYYPLPLDLVKIKGAKKGDFPIPLAPKKDEEVLSSCLTPELLYYQGTEPVEAIEDGLLAIYELTNYLEGKTGQLTYQPISDFLTAEPKVGISRKSTTHNADEGMLYRVGMMRFSGKKKFKKNPQTISLVVAFEGPNIARRGFLRLGGEGKAAVYKQTTEVPVSTDNFVLKDNRFKLLFITPAIFDNGWLPSWIGKNSLTGNKNGVSLKLITAALGKFQSVGGFDMVKKQPKPMYRAVPAGSVYYFEVQDAANQTEEISQALIKAFHGKPLSDSGEMRKQGFGIGLLGRLP